MMHSPDKCRLVAGRYGTPYGSGNNGAFVIPAPIIKHRDLLVIASDGNDWEEEKLPLPVWEHVSVHVASGHTALIPTWAEMCHIKDLFWDEEDCVIQFHPPKSMYVNCHPNTLHLWRVIGVIQPMPPLATI